MPDDDYGVWGCPDCGWHGLPEELFGGESTDDDYMGNSCPECGSGNVELCEQP